MTKRRQGWESDFGIVARGIFHMGVFVFLSQAFVLGRGQEEQASYSQAIR